MNIKRKVKEFIKDGGQATITKQDAQDGVLFDNGFIPWSLLSYNSDLGFYRRSDFPSFTSDSDVNFTIGQINEHDGVYFAILPDDFTKGMIVGELGSIHHLYAVIGEFIESGEAESISELDERLYHPWLSPSMAVQFANARGVKITTRAITYACQRGAILSAVQTETGQWRFPQRHFQSYLNTARVTRRGS